MTLDFSCDIVTVTFKFGQDLLNKYIDLTLVFDANVCLCHITV